MGEPEGNDCAMNAPGNFCTRCGAPRAPNGQFCVKCGTPFGTPAPSASPPPSSGPVRPPPKGIPGRSPDKPRSPVFLFGCLGVVVLLLTGISFGGYWAYGKYVRPLMDEMADDGDQVKTVTPARMNDLLKRVQNEYDARSRLQELLREAQREAVARPGFSLARLRQARQLGAELTPQLGQVEQKARDALEQQAIAAQRKRERFVTEITKTGMPDEVQQRADAALHAALQALPDR